MYSRQDKRYLVNQASSRMLLVATLCTVTLSCLVFVRAADQTASVEVELIPRRLLLMTVVRQPDSDSFRRFNRSVEAFGLELAVLGTNQPTTGEVELLQKAISSYKSEQDVLVMLLDSTDTIVNGGQEAIIQRFNKFTSNKRLDTNSESHTENKILMAAANSAAPSTKGLIGRPADLLALLDGSAETVDLDRRLLDAYGQTDRRQALGLMLDDSSKLFQVLQPGQADVQLEFQPDGARLRNSAHQTEPLVLVGSNESRVALNALGNYLGKWWTQLEGCRHCNASRSMTDSEQSLPSLLIGVFVEEPTPFIEEFFESLSALNYPKDKLHLFVHNSVEFHAHQVDAFLIRETRYASQQVAERSKPEWQAREQALDRCRQVSCDFYLSLDSLARLELAEALQVLVEANQTLVAPMLSRPQKLWSNFWGALTADGYYARAHDYVQIVKGERQGLWAVPHLMNAYLLRGSYIRAKLTGAAGEPVSLSPGAPLSYRESSGLLKPILAFSRNLRSSAELHQFVLNTHDFGHLVDPSAYNISRTHPDFYQLQENQLDWERRYLHENYSKIVESDESAEETDSSPSDDSELSIPYSVARAQRQSLIEQPCQDVFWFPLVSARFARELIEIMESFGHWSSGTNSDPRIEGGYESVPTRDIHMKQVGLQQLWLAFLRDYVMPVQLKEYIGYEHDPPRADLAFIVRYRPDEQPSLRPHHDSSTYTLNIALNEPGKDYQGGGCRFVRYNCSVTDSRLGWALMHPGRLTHYHEGLPVSSGTRYIMVTFIDP